MLETPAQTTDSAQPTSLFISYSRADQILVQRLITDLQSRKIDVWIDKEGLKPGTRNWEQSLRDAILNARAVLLVASPDSRRSNYVQDEIAIAEMYKRHIYPVWITGSEWLDCIPMGMGKTQYIDARGDAYPNAVLELEETFFGTENNRQPYQESTVKAVLPEHLDLNFQHRNPYKGLNAFRAQDSADFFGRTTLINSLVDVITATHLTRSRLLTMIRPSGSRKSSVVMAVISSA